MELYRFTISACEHADAITDAVENGGGQGGAGAREALTRPSLVGKTVTGEASVRACVPERERCRKTKEGRKAERAGFNRPLRAVSTHLLCVLSRLSALCALSHVKVGLAPAVSGGQNEGKNERKSRMHGGKGGTRSS